MPYTLNPAIPILDAADQPLTIPKGLIRGEDHKPVLFPVYAEDGKTVIDNRPRHAEVEATFGEIIIQGLNGLSQTNRAADAYAWRKLTRKIKNAVENGTTFETTETGIDYMLEVVENVPAGGQNPIGGTVRLQLLEILAESYGDEDAWIKKLAKRDADAKNVKS